eukprot:RCo046976
MSFREIRKFGETLKLLGYPRIVSVESFRKPNFELVADILYWLVQRHDPSSEVSDDIATEAARIQFLKSIAELFQVKLHIKLNCKKLYQADGLACQELLKVASVLKDAVTMRSEAAAETAAEEVRGFDTKAARTMATELTTEGSRLLELLDGEISHAEERQIVVTRPQDTARLEGSLQALVRALKQEGVHISEAHAAALTDVESLKSKIEHKKTQLERTAKRLKALEVTRPAHQDEFEELEAELSRQYSAYLENFRNLEYLEHIMRRYTEYEERLIAEQENQLRLLRDRLRKDDLAHLNDRPDDEGPDTGAPPAARPDPMKMHGGYAAYIQSVNQQQQQQKPRAQASQPPQQPG